MKGLHRSVIEIKDTKNDSIEKILVFLKQEDANVSLATTRAQAQQILKELEIKKPEKKKNWLKPALIASIGVLCAVLLILFL